MANEHTDLVVAQRTDVVPASGLDALLSRIRPAWQSKSLIERVKRLVPVDPSSACQRLFNAAVHDLKEKIVIAGVDIASEVAAANRLPPVAKAEDILDSYSTANILDLAHRMGLLDRSEWKRMRRCYDIRRDLEHEDDEYEAEVSDIVYIFQSSIDAVLSKDPIELIRVSQVRDLIDAPTPATPSPAFCSDYADAPDARQREIGEMLISVALDPGKADIVRQNAVGTLAALTPTTRNQVKIELAKSLHGRVKNRRLDLAQAKVAAAAGFMPYLKQALVEGLFQDALTELQRIGHQWKRNAQHGSRLDDLEDIGGLLACPSSVRRGIVLWMVLCYLGESGYGPYSGGRPVFYSNSAAPRIEAMFKTAGPQIKDDVVSAGQDPRVRALVRDKHIARRYEELLDIVTADE